MGSPIRSLCVVSLGSMVLAGCSHQRTYTSSWADDNPSNVDSRYIETVSNNGSYTYRYFPQEEVYFAPDRNVYFWQSRGAWTSGPQLPSNFRLTVENSVEVPLYTDTPYNVHASVSSAYPRSHRSAAGAGHW